jgi:hypothetical protein
LKDSRQRCAPPSLALVLTAALLAGCGSSGTTAKANDEASKPPGPRARRREGGCDERELGTRLGEHQVERNTDHARPDHCSQQGCEGIDVDERAQASTSSASATRSTSAAATSSTSTSPAPPSHSCCTASGSRRRPTRGQLKSIAPLTSIGALFAGVSSQHGKLANDGKTTYKGQDVVAIRDTSDGSKLYVAATGKPYPVAIVGSKKNQSGTITFGDWNKSVSLSAPSGAIDIGQFGG